MFRGVRPTMAPSRWRRERGKAGMWGRPPISPHLGVGCAIGFFVRSCISHFLSSAAAMSSSSSLLAVPESTSSQRCYLVNSTETRSLIEHYSEETVEKFLAYWTCPADKIVPKFKFTQNWGKSEIVSADWAIVRAWCDGCRKIMDDLFRNKTACVG